MTWRRLAPASAPLESVDLWLGLRGMVAGERFVATVRQQLADSFGARHVFLMSSGRAALTLVLRAVASLSDRRAVVLAAYTCYSVPAAVARAGLDVVFCDVDPETFDFDENALHRLLATRRPLCVIATHLFGRTVNTTRLRALCAEHGVVMIDDAAQALDPEAADGAGASAGDVSILSFGRGKGVTCVHGGAVVTGDDRVGLAIAEEYESLTRPSAAAQCVTLLQAVLLTVFVRPSLYWVPAALPFLRLGETTYDTTFALQRLAGAEAGLLYRWRTRLAAANMARLANANAISAILGRGEHRTRPLLRLPIVCESGAQRAHFLRESARLGLGFSVMYPKPLHRLDDITGRPSLERFHGAEQLADRLLAVPIHPFVTPSDRLRIGTVLKSAGVMPVGI